MNSEMTTLSCAKSAPEVNNTVTIRIVRRYSFICSVIGRLAGISDPFIPEARRDSYPFYTGKAQEELAGGNGRKMVNRQCAFSGRNCTKSGQNGGMRRRQISYGAMDRSG